VPQYALTWSEDDGLYELSVRGRAERRFRPGDDVEWQGWLRSVTSFAFRGAAGGLNAHGEARQRGGIYWYAYRTVEGRTRKRYLGTTEGVSFARLEEAAADLSDGGGAGHAPPAAPHVETVAAGASREAHPSVSPAPDPAVALPWTKLAPPRPPAALVGRGRLLAELDAAVSTPLTLVSAAAGWGKTTLLAAWARLHHREIAWLSLEESDDAPARFWTAVIAALRTRAPGVGVVALGMLRSPQPPPLSAVVTALVNDLTGVGEQGAPLALILDDYQVIEEPAIHESLALLLAHLPAGMRLIVASRIDPALPLARLRARGQLAELRAADLRFTPEDAGDFLRNALGSPLAEDEVLALARRTEGWAAGLQLAGLALRGQGDRAAWLARFNGGHRYLLDYVGEEILARLPPAIRRFLLRAAVLPRLSADLCAAVTGEVASRDFLEGLERANLFVVPLDEERRWYRLHDLFREALLAEAARAPGLLPEAHRRAARWHMEHGDGREAVAHALAGEDYPYAASLIEREAPGLWLTGEADTVHAWLHALPGDVFLRHARLALDSALRLLESVHAAAGASYDEARIAVERTLSRVEAGLDAQGISPLPETESAAIRRRLRLLRALIETREVLTRGDEEGLRRLAEETDNLSAGEEVRWRMVAHAIAFWLTESLQRQGGLLIPRLLEARRQAIDEGDHLATSRVMRWLVFANGVDGRLRAAHRAALDALALMERLGEHSAQEGYLRYALTNILYAWDRRDEASSSLDRAIWVARTWRNADLLIVGQAALAELAITSGDLAAAYRAIEEADEVVRRERFETHAPWVLSTRVRHWLASGDLRAAQSWAERVAFDPDAFDPNRRGEFLMLVRVWLAQRRYPEAVEILERFAAQLDRQRNILTAVEYLALLLVALHHAGEHGRAREVAARLFALTEPEDWVRAYLNEGEPMERALRALLDAPAGGAPGVPALPRAYVSRLLAAFGEERRAVRPSAPATLPPSRALASPRTAPPTAPPLPEPLTRREREVLLLLAAGASNQEIAEALVVSQATAKKHVGNVLGKLGAKSRTRAVARARELSLL
jgi:LuxR family maltose regulon positive regulatory protein